MMEKKTMRFTRHVYKKVDASCSGILVDRPTVKGFVGVRARFQERVRRTPSQLTLKNLDNFRNGFGELLLFDMTDLIKQDFFVSSKNTIWTDIALSV
jgi:hypothetical protein